MVADQRSQMEAMIAVELAKATGGKVTLRVTRTHTVRPVCTPRVFKAFILRAPPAIFGLSRAAAPLPCQDNIKEMITVPKERALETASSFPGAFPAGTGSADSTPASSAGNTPTAGAIPEGFEASPVQPTTPNNPEAVCKQPALRRPAQLS